MNATFRKKTLSPGVHLMIAAVWAGSSILGTQSLASTSLPGSPQKKVRRRIASLPEKVRTQTTEREIPIESEQTGTGVAIFLGAGGGFVSTTPANSSTELAKRGPSLMGRGGISFYNPNVNIDLTLGWMRSTIQGSATSQVGSTQTTTEAFAHTRAGLVEFTPSLKLGGGFEFGPSVMVLLGTDSSFSEHNEAQNNPVLAGLKLSLKLDNNDYFFRFSGQGMTSVQLENRSALMGAVSVELGIPIVGGKTRIREREVHTVRDRYQREIVETEQTFVKLEQKDVIREMVMFSFDDQVVHFEFDKAQLTPESQAFVRKLGEYLASREDLWGRVRIEGHTDNRGSDEYNQRLSNARAGEIRRILAEAGVRQDRVESRGYGKAQPLDHGEDDVARARNRRVELSFSDVKSPKELRDQINRIKFASIKPSTCTDGSCR